MPPLTTNREHRDACCKFPRNHLPRSIFHDGQLAILSSFLRTAGLHREGLDGTNGDGVGLGVWVWLNMGPNWKPRSLHYKFQREKSSILLISHACTSLGEYAHS